MIEKLNLASKKNRLDSMKKKKSSSCKPTLGDSIKSARVKMSKSINKIDKEFEMENIERSPPVKIIRKAYEKSDLVNAESRLPEPLKTQYESRLKDIRREAWNKALRMKLRAAKEAVKSHRNNWCQIPEFLILRSDDEHKDAYFQEDFAVDLPKFYVGGRVGPFYGTQSWECRTPGTEDYGSMSNSFTPINNPSPELIHGEKILSENDLESIFENYTKAARFCNKDPMGALIRAIMREKNGIAGIAIDALRPHKECPVSYGNPLYEFGIEYNGIYFHINPKDAYEAYRLTQDPILWRATLYRRALYHSENRKIPVEFDFNIVLNEARMLERPKPKDIAPRERNPEVMKFYECMNNTLIDSLLHKENNEEESISDSEKDSESEVSSEDSSSEEDDFESLSPNTQKLRILNKIVSEKTDIDKEYQDLKNVLRRDFHLRDREYNSYEEYSEAMSEWITYGYWLAPPDWYLRMHPSDSEIRKEYLLRFIEKTFPECFNPSENEEESLSEFEQSIMPEFGEVEGEYLSHFQITANNVMNSISKNLDSDISESESNFDESEDPSKGMFDSIKYAIKQMSNERDISSIETIFSIDQGKIDEYISLGPPKENLREIRLKPMPARVIDIIRGIG